jgi:hypothetical protein
MRTFATEREAREFAAAALRGESGTTSTASTPIVRFTKEEIDARLQRRARIIAEVKLTA